MTIAIYPGSFDPITLGHVDVVTRASRMFDRIIMAVVRNTSKQPLMHVDQRVGLIQECVGHLKNVEVVSFDGLTVELAKAKKASIIIRGLRAVSDFEFEFMMSQMNKTLDAEIETIFMMAGLEYQFLTSSMVKEVAQLGGDVSKVVPKQVDAFLRSHLHTNRSKSKKK